MSMAYVAKLKTHIKTEDFQQPQTFFWFKKRALHVLIKEQ